MQLPDEQFRAGHIPTELYRQIPPGADMRRVVIVQEAPRSYKGPLLMVFAVTAGSVAVLLVLAFVVQIIAASMIAVLSASCGVSYTFSRSGKRKELSHAGIRRRSRAPRRHAPRRSRPVRSKSRYRSK